MRDKDQVCTQIILPLSFSSLSLSSQSSFLFPLTTFYSPLFLPKHLFKPCHLPGSMWDAGDTQMWVDMVSVFMVGDIGHRERIKSNPQSVWWRNQREELWGEPCNSGGQIPGLQSSGPKKCQKQCCMGPAPIKSC